MIISDSTTLIILSDFDRLDLLENLFEKVFVPLGVYEEINFKRKIDLPNFIEVIKVRDDNEILLNLQKVLDKGESEAIVLAIQKGLPLIIDEKKGRKIAKSLGVEIIGLLGILYLNYKRNFLNKKELKEFLDTIILNGCRISDKLLKQFFKNLDENK
jgi:predicted nucleic acid-binding protein